MSDQVPENQPSTEPAQTPAAPDAAAIEAAKKLLADAGHEIIPTDRMREIKREKAKKAEAEAAETKKALEAAQARAVAAEEALKAKQQEGLSDAERAEQAAKDLAKAQQAHAAAQAQLKAENEALQKRIDAATITRELGALLTHPLDPELAELWALKKLPGLGVENGDIVCQDNDGNQLAGDEARQYIAQTWWPEQKKLRAANAPGPGTTGGGKPAPTGNGAFQHDPRLSREENLRRAIEYNRRHGIA